MPSIADLPEPADAVVVAIPAAAVPDAIDQAGAHGCGGAVVFSAGFAEVADGVARQQQLVEASRRHALPVCGPNCNGIVATHSRTALWGDALAASDPGAVALISQSGNVAVNALGTRRGLRFHTVVASGNQAVLSAADYLELLAGEEGLRAVALYLEDDGGPQLCQGLAACADAGVAVVVLKVGSSPAGARAAAAHSAALAGDQRIFRSLIEEAGAVWAQDVHELLELAKTLAVPRRAPAQRGLAIVTCSGGDSAQGADEASRAGLGLPAFSEQTAARLAELLPSAATVANPLDYTAMIWGDARALGELVTAVGSDPSIGQVLVFYDTPAGMAGAVDESWAAVRDGIIAGAAASPGADDGCGYAARAARRRRRVAVRPGRGPGRRRTAHRDRVCGGDAAVVGRPRPPACDRGGGRAGRLRGRDGMAQRARVKAAAARRRHRRGAGADRDRRRRRGGGAR